MKTARLSTIVALALALGAGALLSVSVSAAAPVPAAGQVRASVGAYADAYLQGDYGQVCADVRVRSTQARAALKAAGSCVRFIEDRYDDSRVLQYELIGLPHCVAHSTVALAGERATLACSTGSFTPSPMRERFDLQLIAGHWRITL